MGQPREHRLIGNAASLDAVQLLVIGLQRRQPLTGRGVAFVGEVVGTARTGKFS
jgi:hypothetical protein